MKISSPLLLLTLTLCVSLAACSSNDDNPEGDDQSEFNEQAPENINTGEPGGDTSAIAGLWDATTLVDGQSDVVYWNLAADGVLRRYDYQQDGITGAMGDNCYLVDDPITLSPEEGDTYSIFNVAVTAVRNDQTLTITFIDPDKNDVDGDGDVTETPTLSWQLLTTPVLEDLNPCATVPENAGDSTVVGQQTPNPETDSIDAATDGGTDSGSTEDVDIAGPELEDDPADSIELPQALPTLSLEMSREECTSMGGIVIGDIGNGAIFKPEYRCESGLSPIARVTALDDEPIATDGEVCCL
ncbi:MAG: hypothetical protein AB8B87_23040 [Granulosicoccus sp.]